VTPLLATAARLCGVAVARAAALCAGGVAVAAFGFGAQDLVLTASPGGADAAIRITGDVSGLVPGGASVPLTLTLWNPSGVAASVTAVTARPAGTPRCAAGYLAVGAWRGALVVPPRGSARVTLPVRLAAGTPDACASAAWGLAYTAH
jgi:hypothetical protein